MLPFSENVAALVAHTTWFLISKHILVLRDLTEGWISKSEVGSPSFESLWFWDLVHICLLTIANLIFVYISNAVYWNGILTSSQLSFALIPSTFAETAVRWRCQSFSSWFFLRAATTTWALCWVSMKNIFLHCHFKLFIFPNLCHLFDWNFIKWVWRLPVSLWLKVVGRYGKRFTYK